MDVNSFKGKQRLHVRHTCVHWSTLSWGCHLASSHLFLFFTWYSRVCATGKTVTEMCVSSSPGSSLKRQQAPSISNLHHCIITLGCIPHAWELSSPSLTRPYNSLPYTDTSLQFCRTRPGLAFALWSNRILWTWVSIEQLSMLVTADTEQKQLLHLTSALMQITPTRGAEGTTGRASRAPLSLSLPVPVRSGERSPSSHLEGNRGRMGTDAWRRLTWKRLESAKRTK